MALTPADKQRFDHDASGCDAVADPLLAEEEAEAAKARDAAKAEEEKVLKVAEAKARAAAEELLAEEEKEKQQAASTKASKAKRVQSRIKALEKMRAQAILHVDSNYRVGFSDPEKVSNPLFTFRNLRLGYGDTTILQDVGQSILPGARIGVLGANGAGKSTLLKAIVGELKPQDGDFQRGAHAPIGYFAQHQLEALDSNNTAYAARRVRDEWSDEDVCGWMDTVADLLGPKWCNPGVDPSALAYECRFAHSNRSLCG